VTTILADFRLGVMVSDSNASDEDRVWSERKVYRWRGKLIGCAGNVDEHAPFIEWLKKGGKPPKLATGSFLVLSEEGLFHYAMSTVPEKVEKGIEAIGSGAKAAMCAYEALDFSDPKRAVKIVCKHDAGSRTPVRVYRLIP
jgi:hypothetical protein